MTGCFSRLNDRPFIEVGCVEAVSIHRGCESARPVRAYLAARWILDILQAPIWRGMAMVSTDCQEARNANVGTDLFPIEPLGNDAAGNLRLRETNPDSGDRKSLILLDNL